MKISDFDKAAPWYDTFRKLNAAAKDLRTYSDRCDPTRVKIEIRGEGMNHPIEIDDSRIAAAVVETALGSVQSILTGLGVSFVVPAPAPAKEPEDPVEEETKPSDRITYLVVRAGDASLGRLPHRWLINGQEDEAPHWTPNPAIAFETTSSAMARDLAAAAGGAVVAKRTTANGQVTMVEQGWFIAKMRQDRTMKSYLKLSFGRLAPAWVQDTNHATRILDRIDAERLASFYQGWVEPDGIQIRLPK